MARRRAPRSRRAGGCRWGLAGSQRSRPMAVTCRLSRQPGWPGARADRKLGLRARGQTWPDRPRRRTAQAARHSPARSPGTADLGRGARRVPAQQRRGLPGRGQPRRRHRVRGRMPARRSLTDRAATRLAGLSCAPEWPGARPAGHQRAARPARRRRSHRAADAPVAGRSAPGDRSRSRAGSDSRRHSRLDPGSRSRAAVRPAGGRTSRRPATGRLPGRPPACHSRRSAALHRPRFGQPDPATSDRPACPGRAAIGLAAAHPAGIRAGRRIADADRSQHRAGSSPGARIRQAHEDRGSARTIARRGHIRTGSAAGAWNLLARRSLTARRGRCRRPAGSRALLGQALAAAAEQGRLGRPHGAGAAEAARRAGGRPARGQRVPLPGLLPAAACSARLRLARGDHPGLGRQERHNPMGGSRRADHSRQAHHRLPAHHRPPAHHRRPTVHSQRGRRSPRRDRSPRTRDSRPAGRGRRSGARARRSDAMFLHPAARFLHGPCGPAAQSPGPGPGRTPRLTLARIRRARRSRLAHQDRRVPPGALRCQDLMDHAGRTRRRAGQCRRIGHGHLAAQGPHSWLAVRSLPPRQGRRACRRARHGRRNGPSPRPDRNPRLGRSRLRGHSRQRSHSRQARAGQRDRPAIARRERRAARPRSRPRGCTPRLVLVGNPRRVARIAHAGEADWVPRIRRPQGARLAGQGHSPPAAHSRTGSRPGTARQDQRPAARTRHGNRHRGSRRWPAGTRVALAGSRTRGPADSQRADHAARSGPPPWRRARSGRPRGRSRNRWPGPGLATAPAPRAGRPRAGPLPRSLRLESA